MNNPASVMLHLIEKKNMNDFKDFLNQGALIPVSIVVYADKTDAWPYLLEMFRNHELLMPDARKYIRENIDNPERDNWIELKNEVFLPLVRERKVDILVGLGLDNALAECGLYYLLQYLQKFEIMEKYCAWAQLGFAMQFYTLIKHGKKENIPERNLKDHAIWCTRNCDRKLTKDLMKTHPWFYSSYEPIPEEWVQSELDKYKIKK